MFEGILIFDAFLNFLLHFLLSGNPLGIFENFILFYFY